MSISRSKLRVLSLKLVYQYNFYPEQDLKEQIRIFISELENISEEDAAFLQSRTEDIFSKIPALDKEIQEHTSGWKISRMGRVDLSLIRLALYEMHYDDEVPVKVAINEAIELAKVYGGESSPQFVNGVLAKLLDDMSEETDG